MKKVMKILLDYDDVLASCNEPAVERLNMEEGTAFILEDIHGWGEMGSGLDARIKYFSDPEFVASQKPRKGANEFVQELQKLGHVFVCTGVPPQCAGSRVANILENFPTIAPENIIIGRRKDLVVGDIMLDDGIHNLSKANVTYPVLYRQPWNRKITGFLSVSSYDEFITLVKMIRYDEQPLNGFANYVTSLVGPSGSGKTHIAKKLIETGLFEKAKSYTTRTKRSGEEDDYHFIDKYSFLIMKSEHRFFETSSYLGEYYGTAAEDVETILGKGKNPLLVVDINGAIAMKRQFPNAINFFIDREREKCIRSILERKLSIEETTDRIVSLESEYRNEALCDFTIHNKGASAVKQILERFSEVSV